MTGTPKLYSVFDMDRTITRGGSYSPWLLFWVMREAPWRLLLLPFALIAGLLYVTKRISRARLKEINHWLMMGGRTDPDRLAPRVAQYADRLVPGRSFADAIARIKAEKAEGRRVVIATASYGFYAHAIADRLGVEDVVATRSKRNVAGDILARIDGENCYDVAKRKMVEAVLPSKREIHVRFFSDHHSDAPMFEWADEQYAVNPTPKLKAMAKARGWTILRWR